MEITGTENQCPFVVTVVNPELVKEIVNGIPNGLAFCKNKCVDFYAGDFRGCRTFCAAGCYTYSGGDDND